MLVFLKGIGSAVIAGLVFKLIAKKNKYVGIFAAAISAPVLNTGIFVLGCLAFFRELTGIGIYSLFITVNFAVELGVNAVLAPAIYHLLRVTNVMDKK